jgi:universal stress protein E
VAEQNDKPLGKVFVIMDPLRMVQPALEKAEWVARRNNATLHLYCCIWEADLDEDKRAVTALVARTTAWVERLIAPLGDAVKTIVQVDWAEDWREKIAEAARASNADLIVKTVSRHSQLRRRLLKTADWTLLRSANAPTLFVEPNQTVSPSVVLAAVKLNPKDEAHALLNERVVSMSHRIARVLGADLHAVTVYRGEDIYFDRQRFADRCHLERDHVHAAEGAPERGIAEVAAQIGAGAVIVGCAANHIPERGVVVGDTAQRVIDVVSGDVIVIPPVAAAAL